MLPVGPLMTEHRLIEKMIDIMRRQAGRIDETGEVDAGSIDMIVDFIRTYADAVHHGKEEDILFRDLAAKDLSDEHRRTMDELVQEHIYGREKVRELVEAKNNYLNGDTQARHGIVTAMKELYGFYPGHIVKEDKHFFLPVMEYFTRDELDRMIHECNEFDRNFVHVRYRETVESFDS